MYEELITALRQMQDWNTMDFNDETDYVIQIIGEAAAAIEELTVVLDSYRARMRYGDDSGWISVKDNIPNEEEKVLCYHKLDCKVFIGSLFTIVNGCRLWAHDKGMTGFSKVTHWMPLPKPPKEEA